MENTASNALYDLLVTRNFEPEILDSAGKPVADPGEAELFSFDWKHQGKNYGTVVILLGAENELEVYYGDNLGRGMEEAHKQAWYDFLAQLKKFAARNLLTFELNDINRLKYTMQGMAAIREGLFEGYYGRKNISYSDQPKQTRLMIRHNRDLKEGEPRYRAIENLFVETEHGERFKVPSRNLMHGRMLARHVAEGGTPYDTFGTHINSIMNELAVLNRFIRASKGRELNPDAEALTLEAVRHYQDLKAKARRMVSQRGYLEARDNFDPAQLSDSEAVVDEIRGLFIEQSLDQRIEEALPVLAKLKDTRMKELNEFETWTNRITEGTWIWPETPEQISTLKNLLANPLSVGADAINATEALDNVLGDDKLFDQLSALADQDADADARDLIMNRLEELGIQIDLDQVDDNDSASDEMGEDLDVDGVMMTKPSNMSSESQEFDIGRLKRLALT